MNTKSHPQTYKGLRYPSIASLHTALKTGIPLPLFRQRLLRNKHSGMVEDKAIYAAIHGVGVAKRQDITEIKCNRCGDTKLKTLFALNSASVTGYVKTCFSCKEDARYGPAPDREFWARVLGSQPLGNFNNKELIV